MRRVIKKRNGKETWKYIKKCIPYFLVEKNSIIILLSLGIVLSIASSFFPALIGKVLNFITEKRLDDAVTSIIGVFALALVYNYLNDIPFRVAWYKVQNGVTNAIKKDVITSYFEIENKTLIKTSSGIFLTRITDDPNRITEAFNTIRNNISIILSNLFVVFYVTYLNWVLGIIVVIGTILVYIIEKHSMIKWNNYMKRRNKKKDIIMGVINEGVKGVHDIKLLNITSYFKDKVFYNMDELYADSMKSTGEDNKYNCLRDCAVDLFTLVVVVLSIYFVKFNVMTIPAVITLFMYRERLFTSVLYLAWSERHVKDFLLSAKRIFEIIDGNKYPKEKYGNKRVNELKGNIEFKNVKFSYGKELILKGVSFKIKEKDTIAIVGRSGSGKTTIINLLDRLYITDNDSRILIDGNNVKDLDRHSLRSNIAVISQDPYLFNMTIKDNLKMVSNEVSQKQIENVCKICEIHDYIMSLPKKYNTLIGEGGVNLSGGEKQRLAIARALLMKTNIILFDEATSALDNETQANIQKAINNISSEYTMLIVAHRLSTIKDCNRILVIDNGKLVGDGNHKELYNSNEIYKSLYEKELQKK